jgi:hypothetical protein
MLKIMTNLTRASWWLLKLANMNTLF